jgi:hypothetical protein
MRAYRRAVMTVLGAAPLLIAGYTATLAEDGVYRLARPSDKRQ